MKLLIVTDILDVDDLSVGYFHRWIEEMALHATSIHIIASKEGYHTLPPHVHVHSLGEEIKKGRIAKTLKYMWYLARYIRQYDGVFVFGSPRAVVVAGWWWKLWKKKIGVWYAHGDPSLALVFARPFLSYIFTPTTHGYHGGGDVKHIVGHGVDVNRFKPILRPKHDGVFRMVTVGEIGHIKDYETMIRAVSLLKESVEKPFTLTIVGSPHEGEEKFANEVRSFAHSFGLSEVITFFGPMKNAEVAKLHQQADVYLSMNVLPALEKSLIEASASSLPVITSNRSFEAFARDYSAFVFYEPKNDVELAERIRHMMLMSYDARHALGHVFRNVAVHEHSIDVLARSVVNAYEHP